jgi:hypothetical protein
VTVASPDRSAWSRRKNKIVGSALKRDSIRSTCTISVMNLFTAERYARALAAANAALPRALRCSVFTYRARTEAHPRERSLGLSCTDKTVAVAQARNKRAPTRLPVGLLTAALAQRSEVAIQTRGGWKMEVFSPVAVGAGSSNVRPVGAIVSRSSSVPSRVPHCCELSNPGEAVEIGKGSRLEHERPEHGLRRAGDSSGDRDIPSCDWDDDPTLKIASTRWRSRNGSDCESSG